MADDSRKLFYSIGEVADIFHVNESTLRFWEKEFPTVIKPKKNAKGTRTYTKDNIENVRLVHFLLKEKGMTLVGARKKLREDKKGMSAQHELADRLKKIKSELLKLQSELGRPAQEAPEFPAEELISKRMVFAEPGSEMISIESILEETPAPELAMEEIPMAEVEHQQIPEPLFEESPFDFYDEKSDEFEAEKFSYEPAAPDTVEFEETPDPIQEQPDMPEEETLIDEADVPMIPQPQPKPEPEPTPEQNLFYEQPEPVEPPQVEPSKDGWSGTLF
jgi:DNA-binding transcriptional MerR regulator